MANDKVLNSDFWYKSYLLEFKKDGILTDAFTFSVPPQSEEFTFPQRKAETKTFGGAVIADYGNDLVQINLSGDTINQELKLIFKSTLGVAYMTGQEEIFYLRDLLKKYGRLDSLENKEVYLYSLNGSRVKNTRRNPKWWRVFVGELNINRNERKPFTYNYKLTCTGLPEIVTKKTSLSWLSSITEGLASVNNKINSLKAGLEMLREYTVGAIQALNDLIDTASQTIDNFNSVFATYLDIINQTFTEGAGLITDTVALGDKVIYQQARIIPYQVDTVRAAVENLQASFRAVNIYCNTKLKDDLDAYPSALASIREFYYGDVDEDDIVDALITISNNSYKDLGQLYVDVGFNLDYREPVSTPNPVTGNDDPVDTYGYKNIVVSDAETSWDQLANNYYGDASKAYIIANYNNLSINTPLKAGMKIAIPSLNKRDFSTNNQVFNPPDIKDNYGNDIAIVDSDFGVNNGDLGTIGSYNNLEQALLNRYTTLLGARIRDEVYGIQATIGDAARASTALIQASVTQTTMEDPRISSVENVDFTGIGDILAVEVTYIDKNGATRTMGGRI